MTQEEKDLVLRDLCARLPYGVKYRTIGSDFAFTLKWIDKLNRLDGDVRLENAKIFLRPMSSMTEEEEQEYRSLCGMQFADELSDANTTIYYFDTIESFDWLNKKMFDYRGLIPLGSALEAPEGMYNN